MNPLSRYTCLLGFWAAAVLTGCKGKENASQKDLENAGYAMTGADWFRATGADDVGAMNRFLKGGFAIGTRTAEGDVALHVAAAHGAQNAARFLLDRKVEIDEPGAAGRTPLMSAVVAGQSQMVRWLLRQGANPKLRDAEGFKPLMLAVKEGRAELIGDLAASDRDDLDGALLAASLMGQTKVVDELTKYGASVYARMDDGRTALMVAAENGHTETAAFLVDLGANRFTTDSEGHTAAELAELAGHSELAQQLRSSVQPQDLRLASEQQIGQEMEAFVEASTAETFESSETNGLSGEEPARTTGTSHPGSKTALASLQGQTLGGGKPLPDESTSIAAEATSRPPAMAGQGEREPGAGLVMRHYRQRELPLEVDRVEGQSAYLKVRGSTPETLKVSEGQVIRGSRLKVVRVQLRYHDVKDSNGLAEASMVEVEDTSTGARRRLIAGTPSIAHDPVALVEDSSTGQRYLASPGQQFTGEDGVGYVVVDVRPNQIVIENQDSGAVQTLPLRGPRG